MRRVELSGRAQPDARGWFVEPLVSIAKQEADIGNLHMVSLKPGAVRGNHYHEKSTEWLMSFGGPAKLVWRELGGEGRQIEIVEGPDPVLFEIPARTEHAIQNASNTDIYLLCFRDSGEDDRVDVTDLFEDAEVTRFIDAKKKQEEG
ncbi:MAG: polysaccharide biosynthesis C-terminal domain-containing protein [Planctomycetota bacterium]|jgi:dTDP-4-dehydrorhamnose 3,5-epimerase-like enzyme